MYKETLIWCVDLLGSLYYVAQQVFIALLPLQLPPLSERDPLHSNRLNRAQAQTASKHSQRTSPDPPSPASIVPRPSPSTYQYLRPFRIQQEKRGTCLSTQYNELNELSTKTVSRGIVGNAYKHESLTRRNIHCSQGFKQDPTFLFMY